MEYVHAFWVGGLICAAVQILMDRTKLMPEESWCCLYAAGRSAWIFEYLRTISEICRSRSERTAPWIRKRTVERCQRSR